MLGVLLLASALAGEPSGDVERGEAIAALARCHSCHTAPEGEPYAGGYAIETRFGTFYGSNITPDPTYGIGGWTLADFVRAMRQGTSPQGRPYYPAFPYASFTGMTDADLADLFAHLQTIPPVAHEPPKHELKGLFGWRFLLRGWKLLQLQRGPLEPDPTQSDEWNRGRYLAEAVAHCGECHTPRNGIGGLKKQAMAGHNEPPEPGPNVTPARIGDWSLGDAVTYFELAMTPNGDFSGGEMWNVVTEGTARLSDEDRRALAVWLLSLPPHE